MREKNIRLNDDNWDSDGIVSVDLDGGVALTVDTTVADESGDDGGALCRVSFRSFETGENAFVAYLVAEQVDDLMSALIEWKETSKK